MTYNGGKNGSGVYQKIISLMPKHKIYIEGFLGSGAVLRNKKPATTNYGVEIDREVLEKFTKPNHIPNLFLINQSIYDFLDVLDLSFKVKGFDTAQTLIYCDPPYLLSTRKSKRPLYKWELMSDPEHRQLLNRLKTLPCMVMISGYDSQLYNELLPDWRKVSFNTTNRAGQRTTEIVWMNFPEPMELHDYSFLGEDYRERQDIKRQRERWIKNLERMPAQKRFALMSAIENFKASRTGENADDRATV